MAKKIDYASLFTLRADGRYQGSYTAPDGKRRYVYDRDPETLYYKLQEAQKPKALTFGEVADMWERDHLETLSEGTRNTYRAPLKSIVHEHGEVDLEDLGAQDINRVMLREKAEDYSYKHAACVLSLYKQIFNYAIVHGYAQVNPALSVQVPRGMRRGKRQAPEDDVIRVIQKNVDKPFGLFPFFLLYTGFRAGEAMGVKWEDIDYKAKVIHCRRSVERHAGKPHEKTTKTKAGERDVPLLDELAKVLKKPKTAKKSDYIFNVDGRIMTNSELRSRWVAWAKEAGCSEIYETVIKDKDGNSRKKTYSKATITAHQLRHGYATILYEAGVDELTAMELMGHADISTTHNIYTHLRQNQKNKAADKLNAKFAEIAASDVNGDVKCGKNPEYT